MQDSVLSGLFDLPEPVPQGLKINKTQMWTEDERRRLKDAVAIHGKDWKTISELVGGGRTPGACDKYYYYNFEGGRKSVSNVLVAPSIFKKNAGGARRKWTMHEEETMEHEVRKGKTWQQVSEIIGSRTPAACKEHWRVMKSLHSPAEEFEIVEISSSSDSDFPQESSKHIHKRTRKQKKQNDHPKDQYYSIFDTDSSSDSSGQSDLSHSARRAHSYSRKHKRRHLTNMKAEQVDDRGSKDDAQRAPDLTSSKGNQQIQEIHGRELELRRNLQDATSKQERRTIEEELESLAEKELKLLRAVQG